MIYDFYSRESDLHFSIKDDNEFKDVWDIIDCDIQNYVNNFYNPNNLKKVEKELSSNWNTEILSKLKKNNVFEIDKYTTKTLSNILEGFHEINLGFIRENIDSYDSNEEKLRTHISWLNYILLTEFIRTCDGGFLICKRSI